MTPNRARLVLVTACLAAATAFLDTSIVNLALPALGKAFGTSASELAWAVNAYVLPFAISILAVGRLGDALGRRRVLAVGAAIFAVGCAGAVVAPNYPVLLAMRALQGIGASALLTLSLAVVSAGFDETARPRALGFYFAAGASAAAIGPVIGGVLTSAFGWRAMFAVQVPLALLVIVMALVALEPAVGGRRMSLDVPGILLGTLILVGINVALLQGNSWGWLSLAVVASWAVGALAIVLFIARERSTPEPAVRLSVFRNRRFVASSLVGAVAWFGLLSGTVQVAIYLQAGRGLDPTQASLVIVAWPILALVVFLRSGGIVSRFGSPRVMFGALLVAAVASVAMAFFDGGTPLVLVAAVAAIGGAGIALSVTASTACAIGEFPPQEAAVASGVFNSLRQVGSSLGVAIPAALYDVATRGALTGDRALAGSSYALASRAVVFVLVVLLVAAIMPRVSAAPAQPAPTVA
ncbi:MAG: MFS transporter [Candidatus Dormiibacterota bacterium]